MMFIFSLNCNYITIKYEYGLYTIYNYSVNGYGRLGAEYNINTIQYGQIYIYYRTWTALVATLVSGSSQMAVIAIYFTCFKDISVYIASFTK